MMDTRMRMQAFYDAAQTRKRREKSEFGNTSPQSNFVRSIFQSRNEPESIV